MEQIPIRYEHMTLIRASASLASVTRVFSVNIPPDYAMDPARIERALRKNVCAKKHVNIKKGVSYYYEYQRLSGEPIVQVKIDSCP